MMDFFAGRSEVQRASERKPPTFHFFRPEDRHIDSGLYKQYTRCYENSREIQFCWDFSDRNVKSRVYVFSCYFFYCVLTALSPYTVVLPV